MRDLRVGIVGLGWAAGAHIETFKAVEGATVTTVCSRRELDSAALEAQYGLPLKVTGDLDTMLADPDIDIIDICTPHPLHPSQTIAAAKAGKHVIIEKPVAINFEDAKAMRDAIAEAGVKSCVCFEVRFCRQFDMTRALIDQGLLGELHYGEMDYYHGIGPWYGQFSWNVKQEFGGSSLLTAGCHALDCLLYVMDDAVEEVTSYDVKSASESFAAYEYPTTSVTILKFESGKIGKVASCIDCLQPYYFHVHLVGSHGSLLDNRFHSSKVTGTLREKWSELAVPLIDSGDVTDHPYEPQFQAFVNSIRNDEQMPRTSFEIAYESHRVVFAADRSAQEGRSVKLAEMV